jgi:O-antigen/teichoic acid export membrane protein
MLAITTLIAVFGFVAVLVLGKCLTLMLLAEEYREGVLPLMNWIAAGYGLLIVSYTFDLGAFAAKKTLVMTIAYGIAAVVKIIGNLVLIPRTGILGAAQTTFLTFATYLVVMMWFDHRRRINVAREGNERETIDPGDVN